MAITGRSLRDAAQHFCDHANGVLTRTVTQTRLVVVGFAPRVQVVFRQGGRPIAARLRTRFGLMGLFLGQVCESERRADGLHELRTVEYRYYLTQEGAEQPLLRWEHVRTPEAGALWCRHHLQGPVNLPLPGPAVSLNDLHLPTGYVAFEEVLRFCIVDLGVRALSDAWDEILRESYDQFKTDLTQ